MAEQKFRVERDSMGELRVPQHALWGAQTQRAVENFPISGLRMPRPFIRALGLVKWAAAGANSELGLLETRKARAIQAAAMEVVEGKHDEHFPVDVFQTGSATSSNMNANEVIACLAARLAGVAIHPNDDVNMGQSSNDVIPTAIHASVAVVIIEELRPAMTALEESLRKKAEETAHIIKTGRTHLMDAVPIRLGSEIAAWASQVHDSQARIQDSLPRLCRIALGATAVGTGINAHPKLGSKIAVLLSEITGMEFTPFEDRYCAISNQDTALEMSGQLRALAVSLMKIANDLRWMNSGPLAGLGEIRLPELQPGSSIMPGKTNPVAPEAVAMVAAQVIGNDTAITVAAQSGNFQLNVMLPMIAHNLLQSATLLTAACRLLGEKALGFEVDTARLSEALDRNPVLVTAMSPTIGYEKAARIARRAVTENRTIRQLAKEETDLTDAELDRLLDPADLADGGIKG